MTQDIKIPSREKVPEQVRKYSEEWEELPKYPLQEQGLGELFKTYPKNKEKHKILIKVCLLNEFYSTFIPRQFIVDMATHIHKLGIDNYLKNGCLSIVESIANVNFKMKKNQTKETTRFYSFATKYCSFHRPGYYPIYDKNASDMLMAFNKNHKDFKEHCKFTATKIGDDYEEYFNVIKKFRCHYHIDDKNKFNLKDVDRYLWQAGKRKKEKKKIIL